MKRLLLAAAALCLSAGAAVAYQNEDAEGYEGHLWGSKPAEGMIKVFDADNSDPNTTWYSADSKRVTLAKTQFNAPLYGYDKEFGLYIVVLNSAMLTSTGEERTNEPLEQYLTDTYGKPSSDSFRYMIRQRLWDSEHAKELADLQMKHRRTWDRSWDFDRKWNVLVNGLEDDGFASHPKEGTTLCWRWGMGNSNLAFSSAHIDLMRTERQAKEAEAEKKGK